MSEDQRQVLSIGQIDEFRHLLSVTQLPVPFSDDWDLQIDGAHEFARAIESATIEALAQQAQEPVAWIRRHPNGALSNELLIHVQVEQVRRDSGAWVPLYTTPPAPQPAPVDEREAVNMAKARAVFESISKCSHNHQRSARGTYRNPLVARDWKWFQLGIYHATEGDK